MSDININKILQRLLNDSQGGPPNTVTLSTKERDFIQEHLKRHAIELHFWANSTGVVGPEGPIYYQHMRVTGDPVDVFQLLSEAATAHAGLAVLIHMVSNWLKECTPKCPFCSENHAEGCQTDEAWDMAMKKKLALLPLDLVELRALQRLMWHAADQSDDVRAEVKKLADKLSTWANNNVNLMQEEGGDA